MNCLIIDDEPLARKGMEKFVSEVPFLSLKHSCSNAMQALDLLGSEPIDLMFLDIEMPRISGIEMLRSLSSMPLTIITTAFPDYAIIGFELNVLDYLVKPVSFERFLKAANKAKDYFELRGASPKSEVMEESFFVKVDGRYENVFYKDVLFIEAMQNYIILQLEDRRLITYLTMKSMEEHLPADSFLKVNKSYIVSLQKIDHISGNEIKIGQHSIVIGRSFRDEVTDKIINRRLIRRK